MSITELVPTVATVLFFGFTLRLTFTSGALSKHSWIFPAVVSLLFLLFSLRVIAAEGALGFWANHSRNLWGNQVWLDLLMAVSIGWFLVVPQAKALGMRRLPWLLLIASTGCIGFSAMIARLLYLRARTSPDRQSAS
jgi:hypothetical protein